VEQVALNRHVSVRLQSSRLAVTAAILFIAEGLAEVKLEFEVANLVRSAQLDCGFLEGRGAAMLRLFPRRPEGFIKEAIQ